MANSELFGFFSRVNRNSRIGSMCLGFVASLLMAPWLFFAWSDARFIVGGVRSEGRIVSPPLVVRTKFHSCYGYRVEYSDTDGQQHVGQIIDRAADLDLGDVIEVRYLKDMPSAVKANDNVGNIWPTWTLAAIPLIVFSASVWTGICGIREILAHPTRATAESPRVQAGENCDQA